MDKYSATEAAYKNGYKQGKQDAVVHGYMVERIVDYEYPSYKVLDYSECGYSVEKWHNYCPNCGAKMDGEETKSSGISQRTVQALERMGQKVHGGEDG